MKRKKPAKPSRPRNPFYKELRQLGAKVLKNKKKYDRKKGKNLKIMSGLHTNIYTPPSGLLRVCPISPCFYWGF